MRVLVMETMCGDAEFMYSVWQRYDALATDGDTSSSSSAPSLYPPSNTWLPHVPSCYGCTCKQLSIAPSSRIDRRANCRDRSAS
ncbi:hypothetical protein BGY98DRAFT_1037850 [Russula aff. rugulosa BPL654]|nr:hypothetical protein BGY98DRAFT_1037850 [Russula aff. rugulosa BPL654]